VIEIVMILIILEIKNVINVMYMNIIQRELHSYVMFIKRVMLKQIRLVKDQHERMIEDDGHAILQICVLDDEQYVNVVE
jgi:hypothetical protein